LVWKPNHPIAQSPYQSRGPAPTISRRGRLAPWDGAAPLTHGSQMCQSWDTAARATKESRIHLSNMTRAGHLHAAAWRCRCPARAGHLSRPCCETWAFRQTHGDPAAGQIYQLASSAAYEPLRNTDQPSICPWHVACRAPSADGFVWLRPCAQIV